MNLRPLPEGAEEVGRAARGFKMPPRIRRHPPNIRLASRTEHPQRRRRKRQTRSFSTCNRTNRHPLPFNVDGSGGDRGR